MDGALRFPIVGLVDDCRRSCAGDACMFTCMLRVACVHVDVRHAELELNSSSTTTSCGVAVGRIPRRLP